MTVVVCFDPLRSSYLIGAVNFVVSRLALLVARPSERENETDEEERD